MLPAQGSRCLPNRALLATFFVDTRASCQPLGGSVSGGNGASTLCEKYPDHAGGSMSKRQKSHTTSSECSGDDGFDYGCGSGQGDDVKAARGGLAKEVGSPEASSWSTTARSPKAGEMVQVFGDMVCCSVELGHKYTVEITSRGEKQLPRACRLTCLR